jgi:IMP dehydrogenase
MSIHNKIVETAITFDDVLLVPSYSEVLPNQVSLKSRLTDKITLNVPIVSAAMDTVTEADLACFGKSWRFRLYSQKHDDC